MNKDTIRLMLPGLAETAISLAGETAIMKFRIPDDYSWLKGHFPGNPIVPAVAQVGWVIAAVTKLQTGELGPYRISRFKFIRRILPGDQVSVSLSGSAPKYTCRIQVGEELHSSGFITLLSDD